MYKINLVFAEYKIQFFHLNMQCMIFLICFRDGQMRDGGRDGWRERQIISYYKCRSMFLVWGGLLLTT